MPSEQRKSSRAAIHGACQLLPHLKVSYAPSPAAPRLAEPLEGEGVATLPGRAARGTDEVVGAVSLLAQSAVLATGGGEAAAFAVLHDGLRDPLDAGVVADGSVGGVHGDHLQGDEKKDGEGGGES